jgi:hypothetical protein
MLALVALMAVLGSDRPATDPALSKPGEVVIQSRAGGTVQRYAAYQPDEVFVQDFRSVWYRVKLTGPCFNQAPYRRGIVFRSRGGTEAIDRFATLIQTETGRSCGIESITLGEPPEGVRSIAGNGSDR